MADIFLSYSSNDRERVRPVRDALAAMGYGVFWDLETPTGEDWDIWIRRNLAAARVAVVFWTRNSARSPNVRHEAAIARKSNKLVPAMLELMDVDDFPMGFYTTQAAALHDWSGAAASWLFRSPAGAEKAHGGRSKCGCSNRPAGRIQNGASAAASRRCGRGRRAGATRILL